MSNLSRRSLVTSVASLPALAVPAIAEQIQAPSNVTPDPIFAAIEAHKQALAIEKAAYANDDEDAADRAAKPRWDAQQGVFATVPTTLVGFRAKVDFAMSADFVTDSLTHTGTDQPLRNFLETLYRSAQILSVQP